jgi:hypothetical protein
MRNRKTACINGHPFTDGNTYRAPDGTQMCRICRRAAKRAYTERQRRKA